MAGIAGEEGERRGASDQFVAAACPVISQKTSLTADDPAALEVGVTVVQGAEQRGGKVALGLQLGGRPPALGDVLDLRDVVQRGPVARGARCWR